MSTELTMYLRSIIIFTGLVIGFVCGGVLVLVLVVFGLVFFRKKYSIYIYSLN